MRRLALSRCSGCEAAAVMRGQRKGLNGAIGKDTTLERRHAVPDTQAVAHVCEVKPKELERQIYRGVVCSPSALPWLIVRVR